MTKTLNGSALISYGPQLPPVESVPDGALFYKTDGAVGGGTGLYVLGFIKDIDKVAIGAQIAQGWAPAVSPDTYLSIQGGDLLGPLKVPNVLQVTNAGSSQRIVIGNTGTINPPYIIQSFNDEFSIGTGTDFLTGGTLSAGLKLVVNSGNTGLTWLGQQVWHAGNDGAGSSLDADLLDGQQGSFYLNTSNMTAGILSVARGGTGNGAGFFAPGSVLFGATTTQVGATAVGTASQVLLSGGAGSPMWENQTALSVGYASNASHANTADNTPWNGVTGRPTLFYDFSDTGAASPAPRTFPVNSISGFSAWNTSDIGYYNVGMTVVGAAGRGVLQLTSNWNHEENASHSLRFRVDDDTGNTGAWSPWTTIWDDKNLVNVSQLANNSGYITAYVDGNTRVTGVATVGYIATTANEQSYNWAADNGAARIGGGLSCTGNGFFGGAVVAQGNVTAFSDRRVKKDITPIANAINKVQALTGVTFTRKHDEVRGTGLIAQVVLAVLPEAVETHEDGYLSLAYGNLVGLLVEAIKEQQIQIDDLKAKLAD